MTKEDKNERKNPWNIQKKQSNKQCVKKCLSRCGNQFISKMRWRVLLMLKL